MSEKKIKKFENPLRIQELNPEETLRKAGLMGNMNICDIGAGTGVFSFPASELTKGNVYALDISDEMLELLEERKLERNVSNIITKKVISKELPLEDGLCHMAIMVTVLHEVEFKAEIIEDIKRILNPGGRLLIIEFYHRETPMGPPVDHRIAEEEVNMLCNSGGLKEIDRFSLGENFYGIVLEK